MKQSTIILILILISIIFFNNAQSQNVVQDKNGNYVAIKSNTMNTDSLKSTGKTYTDTKGVSYAVYITRTNKLFVIKTSKNTGNKYKMYLKL